jgi:AraC-like DNA-binding protein
MGVTPTYVNVLLRQSRQRAELTLEDDGMAQRARQSMRARVDQKRMERVVELYALGLSPEAIASQAGCSAVTFRALLAKARQLGLLDEGMRRRAIVDARRQEILETYLPIFRESGEHPPSSAVGPTLLSAIYRYFFTLIRFRMMFDQLYFAQ